MSESFLLVRELALILDTDVRTICAMMEHLGHHPRRSTNMAVSGDEAVAVAAFLRMERARQIDNLRTQIESATLSLNSLLAGGAISLKNNVKPAI